MVTQAMAQLLAWVSCLEPEANTQMFAWASCLLYLQGSFRPDALCADVSMIESITTESLTQNALPPPLRSVRFYFSAITADRFISFMYS